MRGSFTETTATDADGKVVAPCTPTASCECVFAEWPVMTRVSDGCTH
jgi:hypothetical protein